MSLANIINKTYCICGGKLKKKINFGKLPIINDFKKRKSPKYPTVLTICSKCNLVQLKYSVKDKLIYPKNYAYQSGDSKEKIEDYKNLISNISRRYYFKKPSIIDIGGNDGSLMLEAKKKGYSTTNIEPTNVALISKRKGINTIRKNFNIKIAKKLSIKKKYDFLVSTNFFAHTNNLKEIILGSKLILKDQGIMIIEVQYLYSVLRGNGFDSIHQDHRYYYTLNSIKKILKIFGLYIFDAEFLKKNNEILRVYVKKTKKNSSERLKKILNKENDKIIFSKVKKLNNFRKSFSIKIKKLVVNLKKNKNIVCAIGASPRGCILLNTSNFSKNEINFVGEIKESFKLKKLIPGTNIPILNEKHLIDKKIDFIIILAWHLKNRLIKTLVSNGYKGKFIVPLPNLKIS